MATARDLITDSLLWLGVNDAVDPPSADDMAMGLRWLNKIADLKNADALFAAYLDRTVFDLVSGTAAYTVGSGGDVNIARPVNLAGPGERVRILDTTQDPDDERDLVLMTDGQYQAIAQKAYESSWPQGVYYNATTASGFGTLTFWPVPNVSTLQGVLYTRAQLGEFTLNTVLAFQQGMRVYLETKVALWLAPTFGKQPSPELREAAREANQAVEGANTRISDLSVDPAYTPGADAGTFYTG